MFIKNMKTIDALRCWLGNNQNESIRWYNVIAKIQEFEQEEKEFEKMLDDKYGVDRYDVSPNTESMLDFYLNKIKEICNNDDDDDESLLEYEGRDWPCKQVNIDGLIDEIKYKATHRKIKYIVGGNGSDY